jgi:hypothetical protein
MSPTEYKFPKDFTAASSAFRTMPRTQKELRKQLCVEMGNEWSSE